VNNSKKIISGIIVIGAIIISVAVLLQINLEEGAYRNELDNSWQVSGKFQIDKSEYMLGEKVFINIVELDENEKGVMRFFNPVNDTHNEQYIGLKFDGSIKSSSNLYISPALHPIKRCTVDSLVGEWLVWIDGTEYNDLKFTITNEYLTGTESQFEPLC
tara:strand:+ start:136 stop:612 length:477 start_codon:yes stop_codon:yes gene_type:complete